MKMNTERAKWTTTNRRIGPAPLKEWERLLLAVAIVAIVIPTVWTFARWLVQP